MTNDLNLTLHLILSILMSSEENTDEDPAHIVDVDENSETQIDAQDRDMEQQTDSSLLGSTNPSTNINSNPNTKKRHHCKNATTRSNQFCKSK